MSEIYTTTDSPVGPLLLSGDGEILRRLHFMSTRGITPQRFGRAEEFPHHNWIYDRDAFPEARQQLKQFFAGERREFKLDFQLQGTEFEHQVWNALLTIPYGETRSYGEIARQVSDDVTVSRAVGLANGRNPISIVVPCHRVIGANGSLIGYGGGLENKRALLDLEAGRLALL